MGGQSSVEKNLGDKFPDGEKFFGLENVCSIHCCRCMHVLIVTTTVREHLLLQLSAASVVLLRAVPKSACEIPRCPAITHRAPADTRCLQRMSVEQGMIKAAFCPSWLSCSMTLATIGDNHTTVHWLLSQHCAIWQ